MKRIGIIGGGVAGLSAALKLQKIHKSVLIDILEAQSQLGGRVYTKNVVINNSEYSFDMGANLIDFQNKQMKQIWHCFIPESITSKLVEFKSDFLLFESNKLRKGDYYRQRFYYSGGFTRMIKQIQSHLDKEKVRIFRETSVKKLQRDSQSGMFTVQAVSGSKLFNDIYNQIILACPLPFFSKFLSQQLSAKISIQKQNNQYTKQISIGYVASKDMPFFSCILFKSHVQITFICSNKQKYHQNSIVVQTTEQFSNQHFNNEDSQQIAYRIWQKMPEQIKTCIDPKLYTIKKWDTSLLKQQQQHEHKKANNYGLSIVGDTVYGKSRITNAVVSGLTVQ